MPVLCQQCTRTKLNKSRPDVFNMVEKSHPDVLTKPKKVALMFYHGRVKSPSRFNKVEKVALMFYQGQEKSP